jgi:predicted RNase H-like nuclease
VNRQEAETFYVGVDRCADGWLAVAYTGEGYDHAAVFEEVGQLWNQYEETAERVLVDVPVGLRESGEDPRPPEPLARKVLGARRSSVFTPPVREATRKQTYQAAKRTNERKTGRSLSTQAHAISPAIVAVDELLRAIDEARAVFREAHPEVCFRAFAGEPLEHSKRLAAGYAERMRVLAEFDRDAPPAVQSAAEATAGHEVAVDDVLDAVVLGLTARPGPGALRSLPADPPTDSEGLPMEMVYRSETPLA